MFVIYFSSSELNGGGVGGGGGGVVVPTSTLTVTGRRLSRLPNLVRITAPTPTLVPIDQTITDNTKKSVANP